MPTDLNDVSKYPNLFALLMQSGWTESDLVKLANGNLLRVLTAVENVLYKYLKTINKLKM